MAFHWGIRMLGADFLKYEKGAAGPSKEVKGVEV